MTSVKISLVVIFLLYSFAPIHCFFGIGRSILEKPLPEDAKLNCTGIAVKYGYTVEEFQIETEDNYILTLYHIVGENKTLPYLLVHGITDSCETFMYREETSLALTCVAKGHDVWLLNTRGNKYSRKHKTLNPDKDEEYWDFSFHEVGYYDLPAAIDFVSNATGQQQVKLIGHSQGTTAFFVLGSMRPEYNDKIKIFLALAPVVYLNHVKSPLSEVTAVHEQINLLLETLGKNELFSNHTASSALIELVCGDLGIISYKVCLEGIVFLVTGSDPEEFEEEFLPYIFARYPAGTSRQSLLHYAQNSKNKRFTQLDHGSDTNFAKYGSTSPPEYDLSKVTTKVALFCGQNDKLSELEDVAILREKLTNIEEYRVIEPPKWNHLDHVWGRNMSTYLTPYIFDLMNKY